MIDPLRQARDKADRPESRRRGPTGFFNSLLTAVTGVAEIRWE
jgi:hypothetical protein